MTDYKEGIYMWLIIFGITLAAFVAGVIYLIVAIGRFGMIKTLSHGRKLFSAIISFLVIAIFFSLFTAIFDTLNAIVILLLVMLFFLIYGLIIKIIKSISKKNSKSDSEIITEKISDQITEQVSEQVSERTSKKENDIPSKKIYLQGWLAIISSLLYLVPGYYLCHHVWQKDYNLHTEKNIGSLKVAMFADSHIGTTFDGDGFAKHMKEIESQNPDILVIAGDFVDDSSNKEDMLKACEALGQMNLKYGVYFAFGNHDEGYFNQRDFTAQDLRKALTDNGVHILEDDYELIDDRFYVVGRLDSDNAGRLDINSLIGGYDRGSTFKENIDTSKYIIVLDHEPNDYDMEATSDADLVLSGHTHGGQMIPITYVGEWFGINDRTYGYERRNNTDFIVTSGISDWEIKFKTGTKSEYVIVNIE